MSEENLIFIWDMTGASNRTDPYGVVVFDADLNEEVGFVPLDEIDWDAEIQIAKPWSPRAYPLRWTRDHVIYCGGIIMAATKKQALEDVQRERDALERRLRGDDAPR